MSFPRYERYKDSGVEWLGEVPEHWQVKRLRFAALVNPSRSETNDLDKSLTVSFVPMEAISEIGPPIITDERTLADVETGYTYFRDGDIAVAKITPCFENGKRAHFLHLLNGIGFGTTELHVLRARPCEADARFLFWLSASSQFMGFGAGSMYGTGGQQRVPEDFIKNYSIAIPALTEQHVISAFLDHEAVKINALIEEQQRLIELLKEKRQAVISHAITRGLNPTALMKQSGVEWLGDTPAHWISLRIGAIFREVNDAGLDGLPILSVSIHHGVSDKQLDDEEMDRKVTRSDDQSKYKRVQSGDLVYNMMRAWQGGFGTVTVEGMVSPAYVVARPSIGYLSRFVEFVLRTPCAVEEMRRYSQGVTDFRLRLYWEKFKWIQLSMPPLSEKEEILAHIESKTKQFDRLTEISERAISILLERRNALISAAVTGKIDVRASTAKPLMSAVQYSSGFAHQLLAAEILDRCNSQRMGRIKLQKLIHLCEYHGQVSEVQGDYSRKAAGPFDARAMAGISKNLKKQKWFEEVKESERNVYLPLEKRGEHKKYLAHWQTEMPRIDEVLGLLGNFRTRECEIISTLYAAWNDLLIDGEPTDDASILHEASSAERWHKSKEQIAPERWTKALQWMKDKGLVPVGYGKHTRHTAGQIGTTTKEAHEPA